MIRINTEINLSNIIRDLSPEDLARLALEALDQCAGKVARPMTAYAHGQFNALTKARQLLAITICDVFPAPAEPAVQTIEDLLGDNMSDKDVRNG